MFFAAVVRSGPPLDQWERDQFLACIRREVFFCEHVTCTREFAPTPWSMVVGVSNEPSGGWHATEKGDVFLCGYAADSRALRRLRARSDLAQRASDVGGRFSALVVEKRRRRFALATQAARVDSIFRAENERLVFWGNQASVVSALRDGDVRFAPRRISSLICAGFFGDEKTPYEGVDAVRSLTTIVVEDQKIEIDSLGLASLKTRTLRARMSLGARLWRRPARGRGDGLDALSSSFARSFAPLVGQPEISIGLTGGMDSRLILAGALAAGVPLRTYTHSTGGDRNRADVWLAQLVAQRAGVPHEVVDRSATRKAGPQRDVDLLHVAKKTLSTSDGMLGCQYPITPVYAHHAAVSMSGHGGEVLRGGYAEKSWKPTRAGVATTLQALWCHSPDLLHDDVVEEHRAGATTWIESFPEDIPASDLLECLYVELRCGRWVAASTRGSTRKITPLLDSRVIRDSLRLPVSVKKEHRVHRGLLDRLLPQVSDLPLANKFWYGTPADEKTRIRAEWPEAFTLAESAPKEKPSRELGPDREESIRRYVFEDGRIALLSEVVRVDRVAEYFAGPPRDHRRHDRFLTGLYTACVLLSENWRRSRPA